MVCSHSNLGIFFIRSQNVTWFERQQFAKELVAQLEWNETLMCQNQNRICLCKNFVFCTISTGDPWELLVLICCQYTSWFTF